MGQFLQEIGLVCLGRLVGGGGGGSWVGEGEGGGGGCHISVAGQHQSCHSAI